MAQLAKKIALPEVAPEPLEQALETAEIAPPAQPGLPFLCFSKDNFVLLDQKGAIHIVPKVSDFEKKTFRLVVTGARDLNGDLPTALIESRFPKAVRDRVSFLERQGASYGWRMDEHLQFNFREGVGASFPSEDKAEKPVAQKKQRAKTARADEVPLFDRSRVRSLRVPGPAVKPPLERRTIALSTATVGSPLGKWAVPATSSAQRMEILTEKLRAENKIR